MGNVTVDPLALATPVLRPEIAEILDFASGEFLDAAAYIAAKRYDRLVAERVDIREGLDNNPRFGCALCATPVYLVASGKKRFFFRHRREDGSCPSVTRSGLSRADIQALKYDGQRESLAHLRIKEQIVRSLTCDLSNSEIVSERQWRSARDPASRRQPDVQAVTVFGRVAFEAQLSTTFLDVVAGRRSFYREEGALLVWIMAAFDPDYRRMTTDDLLFSNNSNILVVDEETTARSEECGTFHVRVHYRVPELSTGSPVDHWESTICPFRDLKVDLQAQTAWAFDYQGQSQKLLKAEMEATARADYHLRERLFEFWKSRNQQTPDPVSREAAWQGLMTDISARGVTPPTNDRYDRAITGLMNGILSAKEGSPIGWDFKHLIEVAHRICDGYPEHVLVMGYAIRIYGREALIAAQDKSGKWAKRALSIRKLILDGDQRYLPNDDTLPFLKFVFPEVGSKVEAFLASDYAKSRL
jgi:hypothetical protein